MAPVFNEVEVLGQFVKEIDDNLAVKFEKLELILVDDGSSDGSWELIEELKESKPWIVGIRLSRNYGHQLAVIAGMRKAQYSKIAIIDADLQDPPHLIHEMAELLQGDVDIVYGKRISRQGETFFKTFSAQVFYRLINLASAYPVPLDTGDFRVVSRRAADAVTQIQDHRPFLRGYYAYSGFKSIAFEYTREKRFLGESKYPLGKMLRFALSAVLSLGLIPFNFAIYFSASCVVFSPVILSLYSFHNDFSTQSVLLSFALYLIIVSSNVAILMLFLIGKYLESIHAITRNLPTYIESKLI